LKGGVDGFSYFLAGIIPVNVKDYIIQLLNNYNNFNIIEYSIQINKFLHEGLVRIKIRVKCKNMQRYNFDCLIVGMELHFNDVYSYMYFFARYMKVRILFYTCTKCILISIDVTDNLTL
jgi:hypothetical protein